MWAFCNIASNIMANDKIEQLLAGRSWSSMVPATCSALASGRDHALLVTPTHWQDPQAGLNLGI